MDSFGLLVKADIVIAVKPKVVGRGGQPRVSLKQIRPALMGFIFVTCDNVIYLRGR